MNTLTARHRQQQLALRAATIQQLLRLWPTLDWTRLDRTFPAWVLAVGEVVQANKRTSSGLAAAYLQAFRLSEGIPAGPVVVTDTVDAEQLLTSLRVTALVAAKRSAAAGMTAEQAMANAFVLSSGAASRLVLEGGRDTLVESLRADSRAFGWRRVSSGRACDFCRMLVGRGAVYKQDTSGFASHDHCGCTAEPVYKEPPR